MAKELIVNKSVAIAADGSKVWRAITDPEWTRKYMYNSEVISDWEARGSIVWRDADSKKIHVKGIIRKVEPEKYLKTNDLSIDAGLPDIESNYSRVVYKLSRSVRDGKTVLSVTEDRFNGDKTRYRDADHFWDVVLKNLKELLEK